MSFKCKESHVASTATRQELHLKLKNRFIIICLYLKILIIVCLENKALKD